MTSNGNSPLIRIVDDEANVRESLEYLFQTAGWLTMSYSSAEAFLREDATSRPGCIILDVRMEKMNGLELQQILNDRGAKLPIIFFSGHGSIEMAVGTMKEGAADFLPKTVATEKLLSAVGRIMNELTLDPLARMSTPEMIRRFSLLTDKEREVVELLSKGLLNKDIAARLGITPKTIYGHRVQIYRKLEVKSTSEINGLYQRYRIIVSKEGRL